MMSNLSFLFFELFMSKHIIISIYFDLASSFQNIQNCMKLNDICKINGILHNSQVFIYLKQLLHCILKLSFIKFLLFFFQSYENNAYEENYA